MFVCKQDALQGMTIKIYNKTHFAYAVSGRLTSSHVEDEDCIAHTSRFNESQCRVVFGCNCYIITIVFHNQTVIVIQGHHAALLAAATRN